PCSSITRTGSAMPSPYGGRRPAAAGLLGALPNPEDAQVPACCPIAHPRADPLGDGVEQGLTDVAVEPPVQRRRAKEVGEAFPVEPLNGRVPAHDRRAEQAAGIVNQSPTLAGGAHLVLEWRMIPAGIPGGEPLVEIGGPGVHLRLSRPAYDDVAEQRHPASGTQY